MVLISRDLPIQFIYHPFLWFDMFNRKKHGQSEFWLVVLICFNHLEKYESQWEGWHPIYEMENKKCSKPPIWVSLKICYTQTISPNTQWFIMMFPIVTCFFLGVTVGKPFSDSYPSNMATSTETFLESSMTPLPCYILDGDDWKFVGQTPNIST